MNRSLKILALNPYHGGSHQHFLESWQQNSQHRFSLFTLPAHSWKWRMRHAAISFAEEVNTQVSNGNQWDILFCTDMLNLAEFVGLVSPAVRDLPKLIYFHENQLTYPMQQNERRDSQFVFTNMISALAADAIWFNSHFHKNEFLTALEEFTKPIPNFDTTKTFQTLQQNSTVQTPPVDAIFRTERKPTTATEPLTITWAGRWEYDKNPETFFQALSLLKNKNVPFQLSVLGESFNKVPDCFDLAKEEFANEIIHWGHLPSRDDYITTLKKSDVFVSTALHEFFGIGIIEAVYAGAYPLAPQRLSYPELFKNDAAFLFDGSAEHLAQRLQELILQKSKNNLWQGDSERAYQLCERYELTKRVQEMDEAVRRLVAPFPEGGTSLRSVAPGL